MHRLLAIPETQSQFDIYPPGGTAVFYRAAAYRRSASCRAAALGATLRRLVEADAKARGHRLAGIAAARSGFYGGDIAAAIAGFSSGSVASCAPPIWRYRARYEAPLRTTFAAAKFSANRPGHKAPVLMQALGMLASLICRSRPQLARYVHVVSEALKLAFGDRERYTATTRTRSRRSSICSPPRT